MRSPTLYGSDTTVFARNIKAGLPQSTVLLYDRDTIIDEHRIAIDHGYSLTEIFNADNNVTPGNVCTSTAQFTFLNWDRALTGFNFEKKFLMLSGVDYDAGITYVVPSRILSDNLQVYISGLYGVTIVKRSDEDSLRFYGASDVMVDTHAGVIGVTVMRSNESGNPYYVYAYAADTVYRYKIVSGSGSASDQVSFVTSDTDAAQSANYGYILARIREHTANGYGELWYITTNGAARTTYSLADDKQTYVLRRTMYCAINVFQGKQPNRVTGEIIDYEAADLISLLDVDASSYINSVWSSSRTLSQIIGGVLAPLVGLATISIYNISSWSSINNISYDSNPFTGMDGYTYRDLLAFAAESLGMSVRVNTVTLSCTADGLTFKPVLRMQPFLTASRTFEADEIYECSLEEYSVDIVNKVVVKQTALDLGVQYPTDAPTSNSKALIIVDNPLLNQATQAELEARAAYIWERVEDRVDDYSPGVVSLYSPLLVQAGDIVTISPDSNTSKEFYVFAINTIWDGYADCTFESTGDKTRNQEGSTEYKQSVRQGRKFHEVEVNLERAFSRIGDAEGNISTLQQTSDALTSDMEDAQGDISSLQQTASELSTRMRSADTTQLLPGTAGLSPFYNYSEVSKATWYNGAWGMGVNALYGFTTLTDPPVPLITTALNLFYNANAIKQWVTQSRVPMKAGQTYTLSCYAKAVTGSPKCLMFIYDTEVQKTITSNWAQYSMTYTVPTDGDDTRYLAVNIGGYLPSSGDQIQLCGFKLEVGSRATEWTPENVANMSMFQQTSEGLRTEVSRATDAEGSIRTIAQQAADGFTALVQGTTPAGATKTTSASMDSNGFHLKTGGVFEVESGNFGIDAAGKLTAKSADIEGKLKAGQFEVVDEGIRYYVDANNYFAMKAITDNRGLARGVGIEGSQYITFSPFKGAYGTLFLDMIGSSVAFYPNFLQVDSSGSITGAYTSYLGLATWNAWTHGYIDNVYYSNLYQQSSREAKKDIEPLDIPGEVIDGLKPVSFKYKNDKSEKTYFGLIHEDTYDLLPEICLGDADAEPQQKAINYVQLVAVLLREVQKLRDRVKALEDKLAGDDGK